MCCFLIIAAAAFRLIIERERKKPKDDDFGRRFRDDAQSGDDSAPHYNFLRYGSYAEMTAWMRALARRYPKILQFISIGKTHEGRSIEGLEVNFFDCIICNQ